MTDYPITPPPELVGQWYDCATAVGPDYLQEIADRSAQWGADQELEACCEWLVSEGWFKYEHEAVEDLRAVRRTKAPSLKEQALIALESLQHRTTDPNIVEPIRRALEALPE